MKTTLAQSIKHEQFKVTALKKVLGSHIEYMDPKAPLDPIIKAVNDLRYHLVRLEALNETEISQTKFTIACYHCKHSFEEPASATTLFNDVVCPGCGKTEQRQHYRCDDKDPLRHPLGSLYANPTIPYDV